ncbi:MAG TPA: hypothetical protein VGN23_05290 [Verrucomicrobiae bacterium]|jgi:hypothetical protein
MKKKQLVIGMVAVAFSGLTALAQNSAAPSTYPDGSVTVAPDNTTPPPPDYTPATPPPDDLIFKPNELQVDAFGSISVNEEILKNISGDKVTRNGRFGAGAGITTYFCRYVGIGGDVYSENTEKDFINNASGNLYLRLPIESVHLAPYIYGGGGYQFYPGDSAFGQFGAGLDIRVTHHWGLFVDARYVMPTRDEENFGLGRAGVRLVF